MKNNFMHVLRVLILLVFCGACPALADDPDTQQISLEKVKDLGRAKSRFLIERVDATTATGERPQPNLSHFQKAIGPILKKKCVACHGPDRTEAELRIDELNPDLLIGPDVDWWEEVYRVVINSEMPPADEPDYVLADTDRSQLVEWIGDEVNKASIVRRNQSEHSSFRRMTKQEYNYALQDLLGLSFDFAAELPPETASEDGFKNSSELLQMSAMQFELYREIGLSALKKATVRGERPQPVTYIISLQEEMERELAKEQKSVQKSVQKSEQKNASEKKSNRKTLFFDENDKDYKNNRNRAHVFNRETGKGYRFNSGKWTPQPDAVPGAMPAVSPVVMVLPRSNELKLNLDRFLPDEGMMRVSIRAGRTTMADDEYASLQLIFGAHTSNNANFSQVVSERNLPVTAPANDPELIHFDIPLSEIPRNPFRKLTTTFPRRDELLDIRNISNAHRKDEPLSVVIDYIEITAPHYDQWPPETHTAIFVESENRGDEQKYVREVITAFSERAWRRPVTLNEVDQLMTLYDKYRPSFDQFEDATLEVLATILAAPEFLYLTQKIPNSLSTDTKTISDVEFASRLSFFLWSSIPDKRLIELAQQNRLNDPEVLETEVDRMLADARAERFSQNFVSQWLGLDGLNSVTHIKESSLKESMHEEPIAFFDQVLKSNASVMDFIHSDYLVINEQLAGHYRISGVYGPHFRKVASSEKNRVGVQRGGILTGAGVLAMNSDGVDSHPLKRGIWLLEHVLQDPPPPPPPNVPEVDLTDPKILEMTLKERIADHRNKPACISCHAKIDPWGIAFENYDALGTYRTQIKDQPVDATSALFNKQELAGMDGLKRYLLSDRQDQFARAMVHKMTTYALGRPLSFNDRAGIDEITVEFRKNGDRLEDLVHLIVSSELFQAN